MTGEELNAIERYRHKDWIKNPAGDIILCWQWRVVQT